MKIIEVVKAINKYRLTFKNWINIIYYIKLKKPDIIELKFRNGIKLKMKFFENGIRNDDFTAFWVIINFLNQLKVIQ